MRIVIAAVAALSLSACATCERHKVVCTVGTAIVVGSVAATVAAHNGGNNPQPNPLRGWYTK